MDHHFCQTVPRCSIKRKFHRRVTSLRRCMLRAWDQVLVCSLRKPVVRCRSCRYSLPYHHVGSSPSLRAAAGDSPRGSSPSVARGGPVSSDHRDNDSDLVALKISLLGDNQIGKTSFLEKYTGNEKEERDVPINGLNSIGKTMNVKGARICYNLWEVDGDDTRCREEQIPAACKDSVAIIIMFDLTSRVTLNSVFSWYEEARKHNQTAIPIIIGTKFDDFIQLPMEVQWTIASQARAYAKALNATLFFSSSTYNINVNKVFKFVTAKLFDLPWKIERNLTIGEPIIDF
ncbi:hypothetical protein Tsubulata_029913 [Turnera subulata]|uniref:Septum-promoting GTP-binding protein 1 n=1 Tax=Turnera subulata TaxID=218843 RepID=A0A9Q0JDF8_9ROSI|nr:hypothetical protein Tsubulata_029913 [Turnera subulata]